MDDEPRSADFGILRQNGINPGYFLVYPRADAAPRYRKFLHDWQRTGWPEKPNIAYCSVVYVDDTDEKAIENGLFRASRAYEGFLAPAKPGETFEERAREHAKMFVGRGEPGASEIMQHLFDADYLFKHDLVFIGSPKRSPPKSAPPPKRACSMCSWASSISPTCRRTRCCARSGCSARR